MNDHTIEQHSALHLPNESTFHIDALCGAYASGKATFTEHLRYDNRYLSEPLRRAYAAGFISGWLE